jgi:hypothetical protein
LAAETQPVMLPYFWQRLQSAYTYWSGLPV